MADTTNRHPADEDPGFEVVDHADAHATPLPVAKASPVPASDPPRRTGGVPVKAVPVTPTPVQPKRRTASEVASEINAGKPSQKRFSRKEKQRIRKEMAQERAEEWEQEKQEWIVPIVLIVLGLLLMFGSASYLASHSLQAAAGAAVLVVVCLVYVIVTVPIALLMMMVIGKLGGIDYGSLKNALRTLGAFLIFLVGMYFAFSVFLGTAALLVTPAIASCIGYVMFMKFFGLDVEDARTSTFIVNVITWVGNLLFQSMVASFFLAAENGNYFNPMVEDSGYEQPGLVEDDYLLDEPAYGSPDATHAPPPQRKPPIVPPVPSQP